jgi:hypothetical protein
LLYRVIAPIGNVSFLSPTATAKRGVCRLAASDLDGQTRVGRRA